MPGSQNLEIGAWCERKIVNPYCSETPTYSCRGPFLEVQHPAKARPAFNAIGLRPPDTAPSPKLVRFAVAQTFGFMESRTRCSGGPCLMH